MRSRLTDTSNCLPHTGRQCSLRRLRLGFQRIEDNCAPNRPMAKQDLNDLQRVDVRRVARPVDGAVFCRRFASLPACLPAPRCGLARGAQFLDLAFRICLRAHTRRGTNDAMMRPNPNGAWKEEPIPPTIVTHSRHARCGWWGDEAMCAVPAPGSPRRAACAPRPRCARPLPMRPKPA